MSASSPSRGADHSFAFLALLVVAAALRMFVNDVAVYSPADETVYLHYTRMLTAGDGYARLVRLFIDDQRLWVFPNPLRWAYVGATTLVCSLAGECTHRALATLSTVAGIAAVALTYRLGMQLFKQRTALIAAALVATSPLQLALGRRALADEFFCALALASIVALLEWQCRAHIAWLAAWIVLTTLTIAAKEQFLFIYPVVLLFWWLRSRAIGWRELLAWAAPPFLFFAVFCFLARDVTSFFRIARIITSVMNASYAEQYQSGPPHRLLIDFLAVAPLVTIAFIVAAFAASRPAQRHLLALAAGIVIVHSLLSSKNLRYAVTADAPMRTLVAAWLPRRRWVIVALVANAAIELALFRTIFVTGGVYDPVTYELLRALKMLPH